MTHLSQSIGECLQEHTRRPPPNLTRSRGLSSLSRSWPYLPLSSPISDAAFGLVAHSAGAAPTTDENSGVVARRRRKFLGVREPVASRTQEPREHRTVAIEHEG